MRFCPSFHVARNPDARMECNGSEKYNEVKVVDPCGLPYFGIPPHDNCPQS